MNRGLRSKLDSRVTFFKLTIIECFPCQALSIVLDTLFLHLNFTTVPSGIIPILELWKLRLRECA